MELSTSLQLLGRGQRAQIRSSARVTEELILGVEIRKGTPMGKKGRNES